MKLHSSIIAISVSILFLCSIPSGYASSTSSGDASRDIEDPSADLDNRGDSAAGGDDNYAEDGNDSIGHQRDASDNGGQDSVSSPVRPGYLRKLEQQDMVVSTDNKKNDSKAVSILPFIPIDDDGRIIGNDDRSLQSSCYYLHFTTHWDKHAASHGPFEIEGYGKIPRSCYERIGANCDIKICDNSTDRLVITAKTTNGWMFTISGDIGPLVDYSTVSGGRHIKPFPTLMDTDQFDSMQTYELRKCYDLYFKTEESSKYAGSDGPFKITDYGVIPSECHISPGAECHIKVCPSHENSNKLTITAGTINAWYFTISGDIGPLVDYSTVSGGRHIKSHAAMDTDQFDYVQIYDLVVSHHTSRASLPLLINIANTVILYYCTQFQIIMFDLTMYFHSNMFTMFEKKKEEFGEWSTLFRANGAPRSVTAYFSEEGTGRAYYTGGLVGGIRCQGSNCDNKRLLTYEYAGHSPLIVTDTFTGWFSEENYKDAPKVCPENMVVMSMSCKGRYCDSIKLRCAFLAFGYRLASSGVKRGSATSNSSKDRSGYCDDGYYLIGAKCRRSFCKKVEFICARVEYNAIILDRITPPSDLDLALKFAPAMYFDHNADQFPMALSVYWGMSEYDASKSKRYLPNYSPSSTFDPDTMALSYTVYVCAERTKIVYYSFYKGQQACFLGIRGDHEGDFEKIVVELTSDLKDIYRVRYYQHSGFYSRARGKFETDSDGGIHPKSYVGKNSNGQYHDDGGSGSCLYFEDYRNIKSSGKKFNSWISGTLDTTKTDDEWYTFTGTFGKIHNPIAKNSESDNICSTKPCKDKGCKKNSV